MGDKPLLALTPSLGVAPCNRAILYPIALWVLKFLLLPPSTQIFPLMRSEVELCGARIFSHFSGIKCRLLNYILVNMSSPTT